MQSCILDLDKISLIVQPCEDFIAAADFLPGSSCAEASFDLQCLAAVLKDLVLQEGGQEKAVGVQQLSQSSTSTFFHLDIQKLCSFRNSAIKGLWGVKQLPTVGYVELLQLDLQGRLSQVASLPAAACYKDSRTSFDKIGAALCVACQNLQILVRREQSANPGVAEPQQKTGSGLTAKHKVTFSTVSLTGQPATQWIAAIKSLQLPGKLVFVVAWSQAYIESSIQHEPAILPHVKIGKAAVVPELRAGLTAAANAIKKAFLK